MQENLWGEMELHSPQRLPGQSRTTYTQPRPDNFAWIVYVESTYHTEEQPFCFADETCPCHEDIESIGRVAQWVQQGLMTQEEATEYISGRTL